jgi:amino acid permease
MHIIKSFVGLGFLALPYALSQAGWLVCYLVLCWLLVKSSSLVTAWCGVACLHRSSEQLFYEAPH